MASPTVLWTNQQQSTPKLRLSAQRRCLTTTGRPIFLRRLTPTQRTKYPAQLGQRRVSTTSKKATVRSPLPAEKRHIQVEGQGGLVITLCFMLTPSKDQSLAQSSPFVQPPEPQTNLVPSVDPAQAPVLLSEYGPLPPSAASAPVPPQPIPYACAPYRQPHGSHGSIVFGGYSETTSSSPAPPYFPADLQHHPLQLQANENGAYHPKLELHGNYAQPVLPPVNGVRPSVYHAFYPPPDPYLPEQQQFEQPHPRYNYPSFAPSDGYTPSSRTHTSAFGQQSGPSSAAGSGGYAVVDGSQNGSIGSATARISSVPEFGSQPLPLRLLGSFSHPPQPPRNDKAEQASLGPSSLQSHLASHFGDDEFADCVIELRRRDRPSEHLVLPAHRLIVAQSPFLRRQLREAPRDESAKSIVTLDAAGPFLDMERFQDTVRYLYGASINSLLDGLWRCRPRHGDYSSADLLDRVVEGLLGFGAAGSLLQLDEFVSSALGRVADLIRWETLGKVLVFAIAESVGKGLSALNDATLPGTSSQGRDGPPDHKATAAEILLHNGETASPIAEDDAFFHSVLSRRLLCDSLDFIIRNFPSNFTLLTSAPPLPLLHRLPKTNEAVPPVSTPSKRDPRLKMLRFGDLPSEDDARKPPDHVTTTLSSTLLSLPFPLLRHVLEAGQLGPLHPHDGGLWTSEAREELARSVVAERERRRQKAVQDQQADFANHVQGSCTGIEDADRQITEALDWEESVVHLHPLAHDLLSHPHPSPPVSHSPSSNALDRHAQPSQPLPQSSSPPQSSSGTRPSPPRSTSLSFTSTETLDHEPTHSHLLSHAEAGRRTATFELKRTWVRLD